MTALKYPDTVQQKISLLEAANGAGLFVGPVFGGLIFQFTHFCVPFYFFSFLFLATLPFLYKNLTADLDQVDDTLKEEAHISYFELLKHKRVLFAAFVQFFNVLEFTMGTPIFGPRLIEDYGFSNAVVGLCFALPTFTYVLTGPIFLPIVTKGFEFRATMMTGFFILVIAGYLIGPSQLLGLPEYSSVLMIMGLSLIGVGAAFTVIPVIPEMLNSVKGYYEGKDAQLSDNFSGIFNVAGGFGQIVGPMLAGYLHDQVGFNWTFDIFGTTLF